MKNSIPGVGLTTGTKRRDKGVAMAGMFTPSHPILFISNNTYGNSIFRRDESPTSNLATSTKCRQRKLSSLDGLRAQLQLRLCQGQVVGTIRNKLREVRTG